MNALPSSQFGFRRGRSTTTALAFAHVEWTLAKQEGQAEESWHSIFLVPFDTVDKATVLPKLESLGVKGTALT